jgi:hypothetical protein
MTKLSDDERIALYAGLILEVLQTEATALLGASDGTNSLS